MKILNLVYPENSDIKYQIQRFPDGQQNVVILSISDNNDNIVTASELQGVPNKGSVQIKSRLNNWLDLELIVCAVASLRELGVEEIHLYTPYIIGARSDRKFEEGGNNYLKDVICPIINSLNFKTVTCIDPHSDVLEACIKGFRKENNLDLLNWSLSNTYGSNKWIKNNINDFILISPDAGASKKIYKIAEQIGYTGDIITCSKDRDKDGKLTKTIVPFTKGALEYSKKDFIIIDDICDGGATFINIAKCIKEHHELNVEYYNTDKFRKEDHIQPIKIYLIVTHGIFSKGFSELSEYFDGIYCTNSYSQLHTKHFPEMKNIKQLNVY